jgi:hypothetical protein
MPPPTATEKAKTAASKVYFETLWEVYTLWESDLYDAKITWLYQEPS